MIELLSDMPVGVAGISVSGKLSRDDLAVVPTLEDAFKGDDQLKTNLVQEAKTRGVELWTA